MELIVFLLLAEWLVCFIDPSNNGCTIKVWKFILIWQLKPILRSNFNLCFYGFIFWSLKENSFAKVIYICTLIPLPEISPRK